MASAEMIDYSKGPTLRFKFCDLIYMGYFKDVFAFDQISLNNFIVYGSKFGTDEIGIGRLVKCIMRLNYLIGGEIEDVVSADGDKIFMKRKTFIIADWLYGGYLSTMLPRAISLLQAIVNVLKGNEFKLTPNCVKGIQMIIDTYEHVMFE